MELYFVLLPRFASHCKSHPLNACCARILPSFIMPFTTHHLSVQWLLRGILNAILIFPVTNAVTAQSIDFARDIRPILSDACFRCHGPDEGTREADLRLDTRDGLFGDLGGYVVVEPSTPEKSELITRILTDDPDLQMPPVGSKQTLSDDEKLQLVRWVRAGAPWREHWAFLAPSVDSTAPGQPEKRGLPPLDDDRTPSQPWGRTEIDQFILEAQRSAGLRPSSDADPYSLVRRLYLDLIGLPPEPADADRWIARIWPQPDSNRTDVTQKSAAANLDERAYEQLVDSLLDSPRYGERWARRWLDLARYADTNGYEKDRDRDIWPYRDWVIRALNADMPFDQFTIEQIAGDMLPGATTDQRIATGFHRNTMLNEEGGIDPLEFRFHAMTDRVATTGTTWLGLTLGCCQCHTHKYDPISHTEYYQLMAFLNNADEPQLELPTQDFEHQWNKNRRQATQLIDALVGEWSVASSKGKPLQDDAGAPSDDSSRNTKPHPAEALSSTQRADAQRTIPPALAKAFSKWLEQERANLARWETLTPTRATSNLPSLHIQPDQSIFASGDTAKRDDYFVDFEPSSHPMTAIRLEALPDERLPARGPGSTYYEGTLGDFYLTEIKVEADGARCQLADASESFARNRYGKNPVSAKLAIDGDVQTGWSVHGRQGERHVAVFLLERPIPAGRKLSIQMTFGRHFASSLGRFRWSATSATNRPEARAHSDELSNLLKASATRLEPEQEDTLLTAFLMESPRLEKQTEKIRKLLARPSVPTTLVMSERESNFRATHRHHRGEYLQPREAVDANVPAVLPRLPDHFQRNRLGFARWIVSPENPLTARVAVNRAWATFFGTGLVKTVDDFGMQGDAPSHPELLDWLAIQFVRADGWSQKALHRRIVCSSVYRQSARVNPQALSLDPNNRLLSYFPRQRLEAEILRDSLLVAAGKLSLKMGGPPVRPPQPAGVTEVAYGNPKWVPSQGDDRFRRSIYTYVKRTAPFAMFSTFDAPSGEACIALRNRSNSPLQALTLLNDVMLVELARATGERFQIEDTDSVAIQRQLTRLFRAVLVRPPSPEEVERLAAFYDSQLQQFRSAPRLAREFLQPSDENQLAPPGDASSSDDASSDDAIAGEVSSNPSEAAARQAAWSATARVLFGTDEAQTRE